MSRFKQAQNDILLFYCPGCEEPHQISTAWGWNGDLEFPSLRSSVKVSGFEIPTEDEITRILAGEEVSRRPVLCHSTITEGIIKYLDDCTHQLRNFKQLLPDWSEYKKSLEATENDPSPDG